MLLQAAILRVVTKTAISAAKRAFLRNGNPLDNPVADLLKTKQTTPDPEIKDEVARVLAWLLRAVAILAMIKAGQLVGVDITPYLNQILQEFANVSTEVNG